MPDHDGKGHLEREMRPLKGVKDNYHKTVLTLDRFGMGSDEGIGVVNVIDWLLGRPSKR